jgi:hypothetical protein
LAAFTDDHPRAPAKFQRIRAVYDLSTARGDQGTDGDKAAIPWRESRTQPQIVEQNLGGVLHDPWNRRSDQLLDGSRALSLRCLVKGKEFVRIRPTNRTVYGDLESRRFTAVSFEPLPSLKVVINTGRRMTRVAGILFRNLI